MSLVKAATYADRDKTAALLEQIRSEHPAHWPHGLSPQMFEPGDLFLIRKQAAEDPVGFVGWQEREMGAERVGLYSIGVLPQWRHQGIAKVAVAKLLADKARGVDRVAALVVDGNIPSEKLAEALGVPVLKKRAFVAGAKNVLGHVARLGKVAPAGEIATRWGTTLGVPLTMDAIAYGRDPHAAYMEQPMTTGRTVNALLNAAIGRWTGGAKTGLAGFERAMTAPIKDLVFQATPATEAIKRMADRITDKGTGGETSQQPATTTSGTSSAAAGMSPGAALLGAGLLTGGIGLSAYAIQKAMRDKAEAPVNIQTSQGGRLKVTLPTQNPGDSETVIDLPFDEQNALSNNLRNRLTLDTRRRLFAETKARIRHRGTKQLQAV